MKYFSEFFFKFIYINNQSNARTEVNFSSHWKLLNNSSPRQVATMSQEQLSQRNFCLAQGSNHWPMDYKSNAIYIELTGLDKQACKKKTGRVVSIGKRGNGEVGWGGHLGKNTNLL